MKRAGGTRIGTCLLVLWSMLPGCTPHSFFQPTAENAPTTGGVASGSLASQPALIPEGDVVPIAQLTQSTERSDPASPPSLEGLTELSVEALIKQVLARNPSLAEMVAAWQAASARPPQVSSLDDPMLTGWTAPASIWSPHVDYAARLEVSQKYPWCGKLDLRGANAQAEASAAGHDIEELRLRLVESARSAFYEYFQVTRALSVNEEALKLLKEFRENAELRYRLGRAPQQDLLQADVEIGRQQERRLLLERMREVIIARINTLVHLPTNSPLPPPPDKLSLTGHVPNVQELQAAALSHRPDLQALADRIAAEQASLALAQKEFYPDIEVMAAYDSFWQPPQQAQQGQIGVRLNLPVRTCRRNAAVAEAHARLSQRQAELDRQRDQVNLQVQEAAAQVRESERVVLLYTNTILNAAEANVKAAQSAYATGSIPFLSLIEAERNLVGLRDRYYEALADYFRRRAALERAVGGPLAATGKALEHSQESEELDRPRKAPKPEEPGNPRDEARLPAEAKGCRMPDSGPALHGKMK